MAKEFKITTFTEERAYHNTAILIFLKAVKSAFEHADVTIGNSLNQGYYAYGRGQRHDRWQDQQVA